MEEYLKRENGRRVKMMISCIVVLVILVAMYVVFLVFVKADPNHDEYMNYEAVIIASIGGAIFMGGLIITSVVRYSKQYTHVWRMYQDLKHEEKMLFERDLTYYKDEKNAIIISDSALCVLRTELGIVNGRNNCVFIPYREVTKLTYNQYFGRNIQGFEVIVQCGKVKQYLDLSVGSEASDVCKWFMEKCPHVEVEYKGLSKAFIDHLNK